MRVSKTHGVWILKGRQLQTTVLWEMIFDPLEVDVVFERPSWCHVTCKGAKMREIPSQR